jgi:threonine/homoserine/homoserine lactone efflux protein
MYKFVILGMVIDLNIGILFSYIFLGLTLAAPIGPVNSARLDKGLKNGFWHAWIVGLGSMFADAFYMLLVYLGLVQFLGIPIVQIFLWLFGSFVLIYTGVESILKTNTLSLNYDRNKDSLLRCFITGLIMSISSPLSVLFWLGIYGSVLAKTASTYGNELLIVYSSMIFLGLAIWDIFVASLARSFRHHLNNKILFYISIVSGASLIGFGLYFGYQGITAF